MAWKEKAKTILETIKTIFAVVGLVLAAVVALLFFKRKQAEEYLKLLEGRLKSKEKELADLKKIEEQQKLRQQEIDARYQQIIEDLKIRHQIEIEKLNEEKKQELRRLIEMYKDDPEAQAEHLNTLFGLNN
jgi:LPXTG-motif cell wall-anchored protein